MSTRMSPEDRRAFVATRAILHGQRDRPTRGDSVYAVYAIILVTAFLVFPVVRAVAIGLGASTATAWAVDGLSPGVLALILVALTFVVAILGRVFGPIIPSVQYIDVVVGSPLPRRLTLRRFVRRAVLWSSLAGLIAAAALLSVQATGTRLDVAGTVVFLCAAAFGGAQVTVFWLIGQVSTAHRARTLASLGAGAALIAALLLTPWGEGIVVWLGPWGWVALAWSGATAGLTPAIIVATVLTAASILSLGWTGRLVDQLTHTDLRTQAERWGVISALVTTGDLKGAANRLRARPRRGRTWHVRLPASPVVAVVQRDLLGLRRFPYRSAVGAVLTLAAGAFLAWTLTDLVAVPLAPFVAPLFAYFACGFWVGGLRMFAGAIGASSPFGLSARLQVSAHLIAPGVIAIALMSAGAMAASLGFGSITAATLAWAVTTAVFVTVMQAFSALKGTLPVELLSPIPTPAGDAAMIFVAVWLADAVIIVGVVGGTLRSLVASPSELFRAILLLLGATALIGLWASARLTRLVRPWA